MSWRTATAGLACLLALTAAGCGSSGRTATTTTVARRPTPIALLKTCLRRHGYASTPESLAYLETAPRRFEFTAVWAVLNPSRVALSLTFSKTTAGAKRALVWTRRENAKIGRGVVKAPVVRFGRIDVLWTAEPVLRDTKPVYGCVRQAA